MKKIGFEKIFIKACYYSYKYFKFLSPKEKENFSKEFKRALEFLNWEYNGKKITPKKVIVLSRIIGLITFFIGSLVFWNGFSFIKLFFFFFLPFITAQFITDYPKNKSSLRKIKSLSEISDVLLNLIISLKQNPNLEEAFSFVSKHNQGEIGRDFKRALWKCLSGRKSNLREEMDKIAEKWGYWSEGFKRSLFLIEASFSEKNEEKRNKILDKALEITLEDINYQMTNYLNSLKIPTLILFSFGTVLPLLIVSLLPLLGFTSGTSLSMQQVGFLLISSIIATIFYSNNIIRKRPASYSEIRLPEKIPGLPKKGFFKLRNRVFNSKFYSIIISIIICAPGILFLIDYYPFIRFSGLFWQFLLKVNTLSIVLGISAGISFYYWSISKDRTIIRNKIDEMEESLIDVLYKIASRMSEGRSPEESVEWTAHNTKGGLEEPLTRAVSLIKKRNMTLKQAFFDEKIGVLNTIYSTRIKTVFSIFISSCKKGISSASQILFNLSTQLGIIKSLDKKLRQNLSQSLSMMYLTAVFFAPTICGLIVTMQQLIGNSFAKVSYQLSGQFSFLTFNFQSFNTYLLQLFVGFYVIILNYLLVKYTVIIQNSGDKLMMQKKLGKSIITGTIVYIVSIILSAKFFL